MRLTTISLFNWKAYRRAQIDIPRPSHGKNVVVVEGNNGAGKTSLLEAVTFCLFGRTGLTLVARASGKDKFDYSYNGFLERALNTSARGQSNRITVRLEFEDDDNSIGIERTWYFSASGRHKADDEEVRLFDGPDMDVVAIPLPSDSEDFVREFVARRLLSENLAGFFLLDGEHVERLAGHSVDAQIWSAIDAVLGTPTLKKLAADLRAYARERRRQLPQHLTEKSEKIGEELHRAEQEERATSETIEKLLAKLTPLRDKRDQIVKTIGSLHGDSYRNFKTLFEERERSSRVRDEKREELRRVLSGDVALALAGSPLRKRAIERISAEDRAARWETSSLTSKGRFNEFTAALAVHGESLIQYDLLRSAWDQVWSSRPSDCATKIRHKHLGDTDRQAVSEHLQFLSSVRAGTLSELSKDIRSLDEQIAKCEGEIGRQRGLDDESQNLADALTLVQAEIAESEASHRRAIQVHTELLGRLTALRDDADALLADGANAAPTVARAARAERFADLADRFIEGALPANLDRIADALTRAYRDMAHKTVVEKVCIEANKPVQLLDGNGEDIRNVDASAGESQVFALAVMSALSHMAGDFPMIMDTPLARLDPLHRRNVLNHFAGGKRQLILLTHPAELGANEMEILRPKLAGVVRIGSVPSSSTSEAQA